MYIMGPLGHYFLVSVLSNFQRAFIHSDRFHLQGKCCNTCTQILISEIKPLQKHMLHFLNKGIRDQTKRKQ